MTNGGTKGRDTRNNVEPWDDMPPSPGALKMERLILSLPLKGPRRRRVGSVIPRALSTSAVVGIEEVFAPSHECALRYPLEKVLSPAIGSFSRTII